jgi:glutathione synthase/RimK-type ligase-like ATP-grasp enzyme
LAAVCGALSRLGAPVFLLDQTCVLETEIELEVAGCLRGQVTVAGRACDLEKVRAAYLRPYSSVDTPDVVAAGHESPEWNHAVGVDEALTTWSELTDSLVVNRISSMGSNSSKPFQADLIRAAGFAVPATLVTTDLDSVVEFQRQHGTVIYKSVSGVRSIVSKLTPEHESRLANISNCPTQFQQHIPGRDFRVHVVGEEIFAHEIISDADDYRYTTRSPCNTAAEIRPASVPAPVADRCRALSKQLGLMLAGIDLRRGTDGQWYCFEANPSPGFTYFEQEDEEPIASSIARLLADAVLS